VTVTFTAAQFARKVSTSSFFQVSGVKGSAVQELAFLDCSKADGAAKAGQNVEKEQAMSNT